MNPLTLETLDALAKKGCTMPACLHRHHGPLTFHSRCHMDAPVSISYNYGDGFLLIYCSKCERNVVKIAIASETTTDPTTALSS